MAYVVYCHLNTRNGKRYVGITKQTITHRWRQHVRTSRCEKVLAYRYPFSTAIRKHGLEAFEHGLLEICDTLESANEAEAWWIGHFCSDDRRFGYNLEPGGGAHNVSPETRAKISAAIKGRKPWCTGKKHSPETIAKLRNPSPELKARILKNSKEALARRAVSTL